MTLRGALAAVLAVVVLGTGCAGTPPGEPPVPSPSPSVSASFPVPATDPARLASGGDLRACVSELPTTWNPWHPDAASPDQQRLLDPLRSRAFALDASGVAHENPDYVSGVAVEHGAVTTVRLSLNSKAVWGDGTPVTARDWIATWQAFGVAKLARDTRGWDRVAEVTPGASDTEVVVRYAGVDPDWVQPLTDGPARAESVASKEAFAARTFQPDWVAGPFVVAHVDELQGVITLDRNPRWWGSAPRLDHLRFRVLPSSATAASFGTDELDWLPVNLNLDAAQRSRTASDAALRTSPGTSGRELLFAKTGPLADIRVRRALVRAIDPIAVAEAGVSEVASEVPRWANPLLLPSQPGYTDQAVATGQTYDPQAAMDALSKAGWFGSLSIEVPPGDRRTAAEASEIAAQLEQVGVTVKVTEKNADLSLRSRQLSPFPFEGLARRVGGSDPNAQAVAERIASETEPVRRADLAAQVARTLWLRADSLQLYQEPQVVAMKNRLANLDAHGFADTEWEDVGWAR